MIIITHGPILSIWKDGKEIRVDLHFPLAVTETVCNKAV